MATNGDTHPGQRPSRRRPARSHRHQGPDWLALGRTLWRHKLFLASLVAAALALSASYASWLPPAFEAEALVLLGEAEAQPDTPEVLAAVPTDAAGLQSQLLLIRSPRMAARMVDALNLHLLPEFNPTLRPKSAGPLRWLEPLRLAPAWLLDRLPRVWADPVAATSPAMSDQQHAAALRAVIVERVLARIAAVPTDRSGVIGLRFVSTDPQLAALGANTLAELYLAERLEAEQAALQRVRGFLEQEIRRLRANITKLNLQSLKFQVTRPEAAGSELEIWGRSAQADRDLLETYRGRVREIAAGQAAQEPDVRTIAKAIAPEQPIDPRRKLIFGVVLLGALCTGSAAALGLEKLDNTFRSAMQIEDLVGLPTLASIPKISGVQKWQEAPERYVLDYQDSPFAAAVRDLRGAILVASVGPQPKTILLTSALGNEGRSSIALCLARVHARAGGRALLIDCNLRRPRLHELTGGTNETGLSDVLLQHRELAEAVRTDERSGAFLLTAGPTAADPATLLASETMRGLLRAAADSYDLVLLDGPPVSSEADARVLAQNADRTVVLAQWGRTRRHDVVLAVRQLIEAGADVAGLVLTRVRAGNPASHG